MYAKGIGVLERLTTATGSACFDLFGGLFAIDGFGQNPGTSGLPHPSRPAKQESLCQLLIANGVFKGAGNVLLTDNRVKSYWSVFPCRDNEVIHWYEDT